MSAACHKLVRIFIFCVKSSAEMEIEMKVCTPHYYKDFKCIAGACTDTCCAGWDVDVDAKAYQYYQSVKGAFGKRLKSVMNPDGEGGCTFTLSENKRCPFLNKKNLCDLYTELGEDKLCDTCAEFPRFINVYGNEKEIGIAPSCKTAGELIFNLQEKWTFDVKEDGTPINQVNDIDGFLYYQLKGARICAYDIIQNDIFSSDEAAILLLDMAVKLQKVLDKEKDSAISGIVKKYRDENYCKHRLLQCINHTVAIEMDKQNKIYTNVLKSVCQFFDTFPDMEIINPDWNGYVSCYHQFIGSLSGYKEYKKMVQSFDKYYKDRDYEYKQLLMYYIYRYFLYAVYDYNILLKVKNAVVGYEVLKQLDMAVWYQNGGVLDKKEQIDIAHLYSRQFEHSYYNYEVYSKLFCKKRCYSVCNLFRVFCCKEWKC